MPCIWPDDPCPVTGDIPAIMLADIKAKAFAALMPHSPALYGLVESAVHDCIAHPCAFPGPPLISHAMHCQYVRAANKAADDRDWFTVIDELDHDTGGGDVKNCDTLIGSLPSRIRRALAQLIRYLERHDMSIQDLCRCAEEKMAARKNAKQSTTSLARSAEKLKRAIEKRQKKG